MGYFVPETLKQLNQWILHNHNKEPYNTKGIKCSVAERKNFASYEEAINALTYGDYDGIGFAFTEKDNLVFIDLDNCLDEWGEVTGFAGDILKMFPDTYTEVSRSGKGLHIVCKGKFAENGRRTKGLEVYQSGRYMAFTGNAITTKEPAPAQEELDSLYNIYFRGKTPPQTKTEPCEVLGDTEIIISKILSSKQGGKFETLHFGKWQDARDINGRKYVSQSEAEQAYINILYFFTGGNADLIKTIYFQSKLAIGRKKRNLEQYLNITIEKSSQTSTGVYGAKLIKEQPKKRGRKPRHL